MAALSGNNHSQEIKDQIVQALTEAGGQVDYVEVMVRGFFSSSHQFDTFQSRLLLKRFIW
jgi:hypothetical protein